MSSLGPISYEALLPFDQHHYHGVQAVEDVAQLVGSVMQVGVGNTFVGCAWRMLEGVKTTGSHGSG